MEKQPYFYPPKFHQICNDPKRKRLFQESFPEHDCVMDPYYPERKSIFDQIQADYEKNENNQGNNGEAEAGWGRSMQNIYRQKQVTTPYNFYRPFMQQIESILKSSPENNKAENLFLFINGVYQNIFQPDPFYTFFSILDFLLFELIVGQTLQDENLINLPISDEELVQFIYLLIVNSYVGITQFRFLVYMTVIKRDDPQLLKMLLTLIDFLEIPLTRNIGDNKLKVKVYKRLLMIDALEFAYVQFKFLTVDFLVRECGVPLNDINSKILVSMQNRDTLANITLKYPREYVRIIKKYYFS